MLTHLTEGPVHIIQCGSSADLVSASDSAQHRVSANAAHFRERLAGDAHMTSWLGGSLTEIDRVLAQGWPKGLETVHRLAADMRDSVTALPISYRRRGRWAEDGDEPSWEREQHGHDAIWRTSRRRSTRGPAVVELLVPWGGNALHEASALQWNGVVLAVLCDILEGAGYRVGASINAATSLYNVGKYALTQVSVKQPEMPLDLATLVPLVAHPGVFRWHGINTTSLGPWNCGSGHGRSIPIARLPKCSAIRDTAHVLAHCYTEWAARDEIRRMLTLLFPDTLTSMER